MADDDPDDHDRFARRPSETRPTMKLDPGSLGLTDAPSWPITLAYLERLGPWALESFRAGIAAQLAGIAHELAIARPRPEYAELVTRARALIDAIAKLGSGE